LFNYTKIRLKIHRFLFFIKRKVKTLLRLQYLQVDGMGVSYDLGLKHHGEGEQSMQFEVHFVPTIHLWLNYAFFSVKKAYNEWLLLNHFLFHWYDVSLQS